MILPPGVERALAPPPRIPRRTLRPSARRLCASLIAADEFRLGKHVVSHRPLEIRLGDAGRQTKPEVERVQCEVVVMDGAGWGTRTAITDLAEVIAALPPT